MEHLKEHLETARRIGIGEAWEKMLDDPAASVNAAIAAGDAERDAKQLADLAKQAWIDYLKAKA